MFHNCSTSSTCSLMIRHHSLMVIAYACNGFSSNVMPNSLFANPITQQWTFSSGVQGYWIYQMTDFTTYEKLWIEITVVLLVEGKTSLTCFPYLNYRNTVENAYFLRSSFHLLLPKLTLQDVIKIATFLHIIRKRILQKYPT